MHLFIWSKKRYSGGILIPSIGGFQSNSKYTMVLVNYGGNIVYKQQDCVIMTAPVPIETYETNLC